MRVCDACGEPAQGDTIRFGWQSVFYESDVCEMHRTQLQTLMDQLVASARPMGSTPPRGLRKAAEKKPSFVAPTARRRRRFDTADVRAWARKKGIEVNDKGRLPESLIAKYLDQEVRSGAAGSKRS